MKWDNDEYGHLKWEVFDTLKYLPYEVAKKITLAEVFEEIDLLFRRLFEKGEKNEN